MGAARRHGLSSFGTESLAAKACPLTGTRNPEVSYIAATPSQPAGSGALAPRGRRMTTGPGDAANIEAE